MQRISDNTVYLYLRQDTEAIVTEVHSKVGDVSSVTEMHNIVGDVSIVTEMHNIVGDVSSVTEMHDIVPIEIRYNIIGGIDWRNYAS